MAIEETKFSSKLTEPEARGGSSERSQDPKEAGDSNLRPQSLEEYTGQERLKQILRIATEAAHKRGDKTSIGHVLLYGPPGLGKTTCAHLLAKLLGSRAHVFSAPSIDKPKDIIGTLMSLQQGDVLFIDEIHRLNTITEELLYPAMEDYALDLSTGKGETARVTRLPIARFVLVGATTKLGNLSAPLRDRFLQVHRMEFYDLDQLTEIALRSSRLLAYELSPGAARDLAARSRGTPRIANRLCRLVRDFAQHRGVATADSAIVEEALELFQVDSMGLDPTDRSLLRAIKHHHAGGPVGLDTLAATLGEDSRTLEDHYEPYLLQCGLLERTPRGRRVTAKACELMASGLL